MSSSSFDSIGLRTYLPLALMLLAPSMLLWIPFTTRMWNTGHYQYFPVVLLAIGYLLFQRRDDLLARVSPANQRTFIAISLITLVVALIANLLHSGLLGCLASIAAVIAVAYAVLGAGGLRAAFPILALFIFVVPLPLGIDQQLVVDMQFLATRLSSILLDGIGLVHFRQGVVLMTEKSQYMTEEACSGIRSLFSTLAVVSIASIALHHRWYRIVANLVQSFFWVVAGNAIRVAFVVFVADHYTDSVAKGTMHELLGIVVFVFILAMVYSTDGIFVLLARLTQPPPLLVPPDIEPIEEPPVHVNTVVNPPPSWQSKPIRTLAVCAGLLVLVSLRVTYVASADLRQVQLADIPELTAPLETDLPAVVDGWSLDSFEHIQRRAVFFQAEHSYVWKYRKGAAVAFVSLDGPWAEWHNLAVCYRGLGWDLEADYLLSIEQDYGLGIDPALRHSKLTMQRKGDYGLVYFSAVDRIGQELLPPWRMLAPTSSDFFTVAVQRSAAALGFSQETQMSVTNTQLPAAMIQLLYVQQTPIDEAKQQDAEKLFYEIRKMLMERRGE